MEPKKLQKLKYFGSDQISLMMKTTSGRDKVCALFQYTVQLYVLSIRNQNVVLVGKNLKRVKVCSRIVKSISNSRKMLRFMRFIEGIRRFLKQCQDLLKNIDFNKKEINLKIDMDSFIKALRIILKLFG